LLAGERQDRLLRAVAEMPAVERRSLGAGQILQNEFFCFLLADIFGKAFEAFLFAQ
jgi:hypothetical protein